MRDDGFTGIARVPPPVDLPGPRRRPLPEEPGGYYGGGVQDRGVDAAKASIISTPPPELYPPPEGQDFQPFGQVTITGPGTTAEITGTAFRFPSNAVGVIRSVTISINALLLTSDVRFSLRQNKSPIQGWDNLRFPPTGVAFFSLTYPAEETLLRIADGALLDMIVTVGALDAGTYQVNATYHGWYYDKTVANRYRQAWK